MVRCSMSTSSVCTKEEPLKGYMLVHTVYYMLYRSSTCSYLDTTIYMLPMESLDQTTNPSDQI